MSEISRFYPLGKRLLACLLAAAMVSSLALEGLALEGVQETAAAEDSDTGASTVSEETEETAETEATEETEETEAIAVSDGETEYRLQVTATESLSLEYDDRYSFTDLAEDYAVLQITTDEITSYQVSEGSVTKRLDTAVLTLQDGSDTDVVATGVGTATVLLVPEDQLEAAQALLEAEETAEAEEASADTAETVAQSSATSTVTQADVEAAAAEETAEAETAAEETAAEAADADTAADTDQTDADADVDAAQEETAETDSAADAADTGEETPAEDADSNVTDAEDTAGQEEAAAADWPGFGDREVREIEAIQVSVTVTAARLTVMFLAGQSNAEGNCSSNDSSAYQKSVVCPEGEVYSTYAPSTASNGLAIGQISTSDYTTSADALVAGSLTGTTARNGDTLAYGLDTLTASGSGKSGPDSGLAYQWNRLTGDKVWVVNAAWSGTSINRWQEGGTAYEHAVPVYQAALKTMKAEISAGHYTQGDYLMFWLQGEADSTMAASTYLKRFDSFRTAVVADLGLSQSQITIGIIMTRSGGLNGSHTNSTDLYMTGPRIAQYYMGGSSDYANVYVVSNVNEQWVTDSAVASYFKSAYGSAISYPTRVSVSLPKTVSAVHADIHYSQLGHNENGITAATGMYQVLYGSTTPTSVSWRDLEGSALSGSVALEAGNYTQVFAVITPCYAAKQVQLRTSASGISYAPATGRLVGKTAGTYTFRAADSQNGTLSSIRVTVSGTASALDAPELVSVTNQATGVKLTWDSVSMATTYQVYRKTSGSWQLIATTSSTSYLDTSVTSGATYTYTVRACRGSTRSGYDSTGLKITYLKAPVISSVVTVHDGVQVTWSAVDGARGYHVYRKVAGGSWERIAVVNTTSYTDTSALTSGTTYVYTIRTWSASAVSGYDTTGKSILWLSIPTLTGASDTASGIRVTWKAVTGAKSYIVYRKTQGGTWANLGTTTGTSYTDSSSLTSGTTYIYTVRAVSGSAKSHYDYYGTSAIWLKPPQISRLSIGYTGLQITWGGVTGATSYTVYRKTGGTGWKRIATVTGTSYTDTDALTSGTTYTYTVRAVSGSVMSGYDATGKSLLWLDTPTLTGGSNTASGIRVTWKAVTGAGSYDVYRKTQGGKWEKLGSTTGTSYTDTASRTSGTTYVYTVIAVSGSVRSSYDTTGKSVLWLSTPTLTGASSSAAGIRVTWSKVTGATGYAVYRKTGSSGWQRVATVTGTGYTDTDVVSGTTYRYTVRAVSSSSSSYYDTTGLAATAR